MYMRVCVHACVRACVCVQAQAPAPLAPKDALSIGMDVPDKRTEVNKVRLHCNTLQHTPIDPNTLHNAATHRSILKSARYVCVFLTLGMSVHGCVNRTTYLYVSLHIYVYTCI